MTADRCIADVRGHWSKDSYGSRSVDASVSFYEDCSVKAFMVVLVIGSARVSVWRG